ncbi:MAG: choice-of-anchor J domain-containing protein, partial [Sphingobacteriia bacterium]
MKCAVAITTFLVLCSSVAYSDVLLNEGFNASALPAGWSNTAIQGSQGWSFRNTPSFGAGTSYAVFDDNALGAGVTPNQAVLRTPTLDLTGRTRVTLRYAHYWFGVENTLGAVEISTNGGTSWSTIVNYETTTDGSLAAPSVVTHDITALAAGQASVQIRFRYSDGGQAGRFWYLDDVQVFAAPDVGITALVAPAILAACGVNYGSTEAVTVRIQNFGPDSITLTNLPISVSVNGPINSNLNPTYTGTIAGLGSVDFTLPGTVNMSAEGVYAFTVSTGLGTDAFLANNGISVTRSTRVVTFPYTQNFEANDGGWQAVSAAGIGTWLYGPLPATYGVDGAEGRGNSWRIEIAPGSGTGGGGNEPPYLY